MAVSEGVFGASVPIRGINPIYIKRVLIDGSKIMKVGSKDVYLENVIDVPPSVIQQIKKDIEKQSEEITDIILKDVLPYMIGYYQAKDYVEAASRESLNMDITVDVDVLKGLEPLARLNIIYDYINKMPIDSKLQKSLKNLFSEKLVDVSVKSMEPKKNNQNVLEQFRKNLTAMSNKDKETGKSKLGTFKSRSQ